MPPAGFGGGGGYASAIASLFASGEQGIWLDPSNFSTMWQDAARTTPVTAVGQPVGAINDLSGRGNHATQATTTSRPIIQKDGSGRFYLDFDGVDDFLTTAAINFTGTDKVTMLAGATKMSDAAVGILMEFTVNAVTAGSFGLRAPNSASANYGVHSCGTTSAAQSSPATYPAPSTVVLGGIGDVANDIAAIRVNGVQVASAVADQGTGNYANAVMHIGRRGGLTLPFNGRIYSLIVRGAASTADQITAGENYVNSKTGAY